MKTPRFEVVTLNGGPDDGDQAMVGTGADSVALPELDGLDVAGFHEYRRDAGGTWRYAGPLPRLIEDDSEVN